MGQLTIELPSRAPGKIPTGLRSDGLINQRELPGRCTKTSGAIQRILKRQTLEGLLPDLRQNRLLRPGKKLSRRAFWMNPTKIPASDIASLKARPQGTRHTRKPRKDRVFAQ